MADLISGWEAIATTAIIISVIIAGIAIGLGHAFSIKRLERFGLDEIFQSVVNAAILGAAIALSATILQIGAEFTPASAIPDNCTINATPPDYILCGINHTSYSTANLSSDLIRVQNNIAYYQTLDLHFGNFSIQPLANLNSVSNQLSSSSSTIHFSMFALSLNSQLLSFISSNWFGVIFATGLVLRSIFLTRKFGAFLIAAALSFIIFYPLMLMMFQPPTVQLETTKNITSAFLYNSTYQTVPIIDLNDNAAVANKIYNMSFSQDQDYVGDLTVLSQSVTDSSAALFFYSIFVPIIALLVTGALIKALSLSFAGELSSWVSQV
ncbi:hypothetical protein KJ780_01880 [Candidatus Micrarchaeota archaeon]|nr:hypothetical protein [Candidatus Micrarchaeota archaeon]